MYLWFCEKQRKTEMDKEIVDRMRSENSEQFQTLVRMHLSFELDLNTDAVEWVISQKSFLFCLFVIKNVHFLHSNECVNNVKLRSKRLFMFQKKSKQLHAATPKGPPFNVVNALTSVGIEQIKQMIMFLMQSESECAIYGQPKLNFI